MRVGITGGAGFIGSNLSKLLIERNYDVSIIDNLSSGDLKNLDGLKLDFINGDINDTLAIDRFVSNSDYIIHLAAIGSVPKSIDDPLSSFSTNVVGTFNILESVRKYRKPLIFSSSSSVYGSNPQTPKTELDWLSPISPYGGTKLSGEAMCLGFKNAFNLQILIFRFFNVFGPNQKPDNPYSAVIPKWALSALKDEELIMYGDGSQVRDFTYIDTVTNIIESAVANKVESSSPINLALGNSTPLSELIPVYEKYFGRIKVRKLNPRSGDIKVSTSNSTYLRQVFKNIDIEAEPLEGSLIKTFEWIKKNYS